MEVVDTVAWWAHQNIIVLTDNTVNIAEEGKSKDIAYVYDLCWIEMLKCFRVQFIMFATN